MFCRQCGATNKEEAKFCNTCGAPIKVAAKSSNTEIENSRAVQDVLIIHQALPDEDQTTTKPDSSLPDKAKSFDEPATPARPSSKTFVNVRQLQVVTAVFIALIGGGGAYYYFNAHQQSAQESASSQPPQNAVEQPAAKPDQSVAPLQMKKEGPLSKPEPTSDLPSKPTLNSGNGAASARTQPGVTITDKITENKSEKPAKGYPIKLFHIDGSLARTETYGTEGEARQSLKNWKSAIAAVKCKGVQLCTIIGSDACPDDKPYYAIIMKQGHAHSAGCHTKQAEAEHSIRVELERLGDAGSPKQPSPPTANPNASGAPQIPNPIKALQETLNKPELNTPCNGVSVNFKGAFGVIVERRCYPNEPSAENAKSRWDKDSVLIEPDGSENTKYVVKSSNNSPIIGH